MHSCTHPTNSWRIPIATSSFFFFFSCLLSRSLLNLGFAQEAMICCSAGLGQAFQPTPVKRTASEKVHALMHAWQFPVARRGCDKRTGRKRSDEKGMVDEKIQGLKPHLGWILSDGGSWFPFLVAGGGGSGARLVLVDCQDQPQPLGSSPKNGEERIRDELGDRFWRKFGDCSLVETHSFSCSGA